MVANGSFRFYDKSREAFSSSRFDNRERSPTPDSHRAAEEKRRVEEIRAAEDFEQLCQLWGYTSESHVVQTKDGYLLGLHRLPSARDETTFPGARTRKPVVYLHHGEPLSSQKFQRADILLLGLLMNSGGLPSTFT